MHVGELLKLLDELGIADNTIVFYSTDNGPHYNTWPDAGNTPFRSEKNSNWEGAYRVPAFVRWPGKFPAGVTLNGIVSHEDWLPTFAAVAGEPDIKEQAAEGRRAERPHLPELHRRLQPAGLPHRQGQGIAAQGVHLRQRRRPGRRHALRRLEGGVPRESRPGVRGVARAVHRAARAAALQPAPRSRSSGRSTTPTPTTTGSSTGCSCSCRCRQLAGKFLMTMKDYPPSQTPGSFNLEKIQKQIAGPEPGADAPAWAARVPWRERGQGSMDHRQEMPCIVGLGCCRRPFWPQRSLCALRQRRQPTPCRPGTRARPSRPSCSSSKRVTTKGGPRLRPPGRAHRRLRQRRHALGRAADVLPAGVRPRPREGARARAPGVEGEGAVQGRCSQAT